VNATTEGRTAMKSVMVDYYNEKGHDLQATLQLMQTSLNTEDNKYKALEIFNQALNKASE
jgi:hypothetical protein